MVIVNSREFRANQGKYLKMALEGEDVVLHSRGHGYFRIIPLSKDDKFTSPKESE